MEAARASPPSRAPHRVHRPNGDPASRERRVAARGGCNGPAASCAVSVRRCLSPTRSDGRASEEALLGPRPAEGRHHPCPRPRSAVTLASARRGAAGHQPLRGATVSGVGRCSMVWICLLHVLGPSAGWHRRRCRPSDEYRGLRHEPPGDEVRQPRRSLGNGLLTPVLVSSGRPSRSRARSSTFTAVTRTNAKTARQGRVSPCLATQTATATVRSPRTIRPRKRFVCKNGPRRRPPTERLRPQVRR
jgi:hypothetical protein